MPTASGALRVRRPHFELDSSIPRYWHGGDPFKTHFMDALSSVFPGGEAFFVRSVLHYRDRVEDPALLEALRGFAGQEGQHSHQHDLHLQLLLGHGYWLIEVRNRFMDKVLRAIGLRFPRYALAETAALEHLTALLARKLLGQPERWTDPMDPRMAALWRWHALEEAEHKSVAYEVLQLVAPSYPLRAFAMAMATLGLTIETFWRTTYMLIVDGRCTDRSVWAQGRRFLFGREGLLRGTGPEYRRWFRRRFHPDDVDDTPLIERSRPLVGMGPEVRLGSGA